MAGKRRSSLTSVSCIRFLKCSKCRRLRNLRLSKMRQYKLAVGILAASSCTITLLLYYWHRVSVPQIKLQSIEENSKGTTTTKQVLIGTPMKHVPLDLIPDQGKDTFGLEERTDDILKTPKCTIPKPVAQLYALMLRKDKNKPKTCGKRAVFLKKIEGNRVQAMIKQKSMRTYLRKSAYFECCYRFILKTSNHGRRFKKIQYTPCRQFHDGAKIDLQSDFINVKCSEQRNNISHEVYDDVYAFTKMINASIPSNNTTRNCTRKKYNVLIVGMDSMSLTHFSQVMTRTATYFKENFWLSFNGYHKIDDNTLPNLMAAFTGLNMTLVAEKCSGKMDQCRDLLIWNQFKDLGYVTAYGEDYLRLPDTFHGSYEFKQPPTDHYMRPLFMKGETELFNKSLVCAGKVSSGQHLLDYALDFAVTYRSRLFFGVFWMNSYSHNVNIHPQEADKIIENFLNRLSYTGIHLNTFIVFLSDHGIRFGELRQSIETYYDERLPFMFMWTPFLFKSRYADHFKNLVLNQHRLVTPYDLYNTLVDVNRISSCLKVDEQEASRYSDSCPHCHSLFYEVTGNRTCKDAAIHEKWCSCHRMFPLPIHDTEASHSVSAVVAHITSLSKSVKARRCWGCMSFSLKNIIRIHFYYDEQKKFLYHVVAVTMTPGNVSYEATVWNKKGQSELVGPISVISPYRGLGECAIQGKDRLFCVCQRIENCKH